MVTICTASLTFNNSTFSPHSVFMCFVWISEQTAIISLYNINWLVFITDAQCVYCAVRTGYSYNWRQFYSLNLDVRFTQIAISPCPTSVTSRNLQITSEFHLRRSKTKTVWTEATHTDTHRHSHSVQAVFKVPFPESHQTPPSSRPAPTSYRCWSSQSVLFNGDPVHHVDQLYTIYW